MSHYDCPECPSLHADVARLHAEMERLRQCRTCGGIPHVSGKMCICGGTNFVEEEIRQLRLALFSVEREREEALAQVAVLVQAAEGARHPNGMANEGDIQFWYERLAHAIAEAPIAASALLDRLRRAEATVAVLERKAKKVSSKTRAQQQHDQLLADER